MIRIVLITLLLFFISRSYAQNRFGIEAGIGNPSFGIHLQENNITHIPESSFTAELNYLRRVDKHVYLGTKLLFHQYIFNYDYDHSQSTYTEKEHLKVNSLYLFLAPTLDIGLGRRQYIHCFLSAAFGTLLTGREFTYEYLRFMAPIGNSDTTFNSDNSIKKFVLHLNFGLEEHIPLNKNWHILVSQGFSLFSTNMTFLKTYQHNVHPGYVFCEIGVMRKYKRPHLSKSMEPAKP